MSQRALIEIALPVYFGMTRQTPMDSLNRDTLFLKVKDYAAACTVTVNAHSRGGKFPVRRGKHTGKLLFILVKELFAPHTFHAPFSPGTRNFEDVKDGTIPVHTFGNVGANHKTVIGFMLNSLFLTFHAPVTRDKVAFGVVRKMPKNFDLILRRIKAAVLQELFPDKITGHKRRLFAVHPNCRIYTRLRVGVL